MITKYQSLDVHIPDRSDFCNKAPEATSKIFIDGSFVDTIIEFRAEWYVTALAGTPTDIQPSSPTYHCFSVAAIFFP
jgi:hypothetical protein